MTDTLDEPRDNSSDADDIFHFDERANVWYLTEANVHEGQRQYIKEKKASHVRLMRPLERDVFSDLRSLARQWEKFRDKTAVVSAHTRVTTDRLRARRLRIAGMLSDNDEGA